MAARNPPRIVAELGRPETPEETAARKAADSQKHRANQTLLNLILALAASLLIVFVIAISVNAPAPSTSHSVDYAAIAAEAQGGTTDPLIVPKLPEAWYANDARFEKRSEVLTWYIGFITPHTQFIAFNQGIDANPTWQSAVLEGIHSTSSTTIDGIKWTVFDNRDSKDPGNFAYSMAAISGRNTIVLHGTASDAEFRQLAKAIAAQLEAP
ncbi:MAG: DUF4245 domain-containing protein [Salinibacterium sp.]|nr:MAG: DUF4245 domain-containing protein [Salinibacterium sp.]